MKRRATGVVWGWRLLRFAALGIAFPAAACLNSFQSEILIYQRQGDEAQVARIITGLEADFKKDHSLEHSNDLAVARVLVHRYDEAIALLQETERRFPGNAIVAANLGTALELIGDDAEALKWIREGVRRDPKEHLGSEWLHVRILEAKGSIAKDPHWLDTYTVLGVDFGSEVRPRASGPFPLDENGSPRTVKGVSDSLLYQLGERTKFVKPPDAIVADLFAAHGDLAFESFGTVGEEGIFSMIADPAPLYEDALKYGSKRSELVKRRLDALNKIYREATVSVVEPAEPYALVDGWAPSAFSPWLILSGVVIGVGGAWWWRRQSKVRRP